MISNEYPLISIVIPVYNVQDFLEECLKSVINQTYTNLEVILIDDGSTDASSDICKRYVQVDSRVYLYRQDNQGLSAARNQGIKLSTGKYIMFVDSDDFITEDCVSFLYRLIKDNFNHCKMSMCSHYVLKNGRMRALGDNSQGLMDAKDCIRDMCYRNIVDTSAWAKLYDKTLFADISFPVGLKFEDIGTIYKLFIKSGVVAYSFKPKYYYRIRANSITTNNFSMSKLDLIVNTDKMAEEVLQLYPELAKAVLCRRVYSRFSTLNQMTNLDTYTEIKQNIINFIKENSLNILIDNKVSLHDKVAIGLLLINIRLYEYIWRKIKNR